MLACETRVVKLDGWRWRPPASTDGPLSGHMSESIMESVMGSPSPSSIPEPTREAAGTSTAEDMVLDGAAAAAVEGSPPEPAGSLVRASPRRAPRAVAQPQRIESAEVLCYRYSQGTLRSPGPQRPPSLPLREEPSAGPSADGTPWQGRAARIRYFLPENWSPSYKVTVFEDSYVLSFTSAAAGEPWTAPGLYHLARPLHGGQLAGGTASTAEFELVWPNCLDASLLESIEAACDRVVPGAKRKQQAPPLSLSLNSGQLLQKLQRLDL